MRAFHPPFYLLSHWRTPLSIPTFGFCRAKNESYTRVFWKWWGGAGGEEKTFLQKSFFFSPCTPSSFSKNSCVTFVFCPAKSEGGNRQRGAPMRQQIKRRVERPHLFPNLLIIFDIFFSQIYRKLLERW